MTNWQAVLLEPAKTVFSQICRFLLDLLLVIVILIIGWLIAKAVKAIISRGLKALQIDALSDRIQLDSILEKGGIKYSLSELLGVVFYWVMMLVTFVVAVNAIGLTVAAELLNRVILYVPNIIAGIFILILGMFVAALLRNIVQAAANNAGLAHAKVFAKIAEIVVVAFAVFVTLEQLKIGIRITEITLSIILSTIGLGLALAFGLGCKDIVAKFVSEFIDKLKR